MSEANKYKEWIDANVTEYAGRCAEETLRMQGVFPELIRVRGHYYDYAWGDREHWWLKTITGEIVDPTVKKFPSKGLGFYTELDESLPEPTGLCANCGEYCYNGRADICSDECHKAYVAYLMSGQ